VNTTSVHRPVILGCDRVVVGVSRSGGGLAALRAGVTYARTLGVELHLIRVWQDVDWLFSATAAQASALVSSEASDHALLIAAADTAHALDPGVAVSAEFIAGNVFADLPAILRSTDLLVVGSPQNETTDTPMADWFARHTESTVLEIGADESVRTLV
jgi:Universal stress protein family